MVAIHAVIPIVPSLIVAVIRHLFYWGLVSRVQMAPLTISVPIIGAYLSANPTPSAALGLGAIGLCAHVFGFGLNALVDLPLDRTIPHLQKHPLVSGKLPLWEAWMLVLVQIPLALLLGWWLGCHLPLLSASGGLSVVYNLWSKWGRLPRLLPELALAGSIGLLALIGGTFTAALWLLAFNLSLILLLLNSVSSGLKDIQTDAQYGARSFVLSSGTHITSDGRFMVSTSLKSYSAVLQGFVMIGLLSLAFVLHQTWWIVAFTLILMTYAALHLRLLLSIQTAEAIRASKPLLNGYYNFAALLLVMFHSMPFGIRLMSFLLIFNLMLTPLRLSWRLWRDRYGLIRYSKS